MKKILLSLSVLALLGAGCAGSGEANRLRYTSGNTTVTQSEGFASAWFTADGLAANSTECGTGHDAAYYQLFVSAIADASAWNYFFESNEENVQSPLSWDVMMIPNVTNYTSMKAFANDFDLCYAGGELYPLMLNADWLVFSSSCGSGYDDGTNRPVGCDRARVNTTVSLNPPAFADDRK